MGKRSNVAFIAAGPLLPFLLIGVGSLVYGGKLAFDHWTFLRGALHARGTVVKVERGTSRRHYPIVRYDAPAAPAVEFRSRVSVSSDAYRVGQEVGVVYDAGDPRHAEIDTPDSLYSVLMLPLFGVLVCGFCLTCLLVVAWLGRRRSAA